MYRYLERDYRYRHNLPFSSDSGTAPWRELEAALRAFSAACPTESLGVHTARIAEAFIGLQKRLLNEEGGFNLFVSTSPNVTSGQRRQYRFLVEFKTELLRYKQDMEDSHTRFLRALGRSRARLTKENPACDVGGGSGRCKLSRISPVSVVWGALTKDSPDQGCNFQPWTKVKLWPMTELEKVRNSPSVCRTRLCSQILSRCVVLDPDTIVHNLNELRLSPAGIRGSRAAHRCCFRGSLLLCRAGHLHSRGCGLRSRRQAGAGKAPGRLRASGLSEGPTQVEADSVVQAVRRD